MIAGHSWAHSEQRHSTLSLLLGFTSNGPSPCSVLDPLRDQLRDTHRRNTGLASAPCFAADVNRLPHSMHPQPLVRLLTGRRPFVGTLRAAPLDRVVALRLHIERSESSFVSDPLRDQLRPYVPEGLARFRPPPGLIPCSVRALRAAGACSVRLLTVAAHSRAHSGQRHSTVSLLFGFTSNGPRPCWCLTHCGISSG